MEKVVSVGDYAAFLFQERVGYHIFKEHSRLQHVHIQAGRVHLGRGKYILQGVRGEQGGGQGVGSNRLKA